MKRLVAVASRDYTRVTSIHNKYVFIFFEMCVLFTGRVCYLRFAFSPHLSHLDASPFIVSNYNLLRLQ